MNKIIQLKADRNALVRALEELTQTVEKRDGKMTEEESGDFDRYETEIKAIDVKIGREERMRAILENEVKETGRPSATQRAKDKSGKSGEAAEKRKIAANYSLMKAIQNSVNKRALDGAEAEMHQEAEREARAAGTVIAGIGIPTFLGRLRQPEKRDLTAGGANTGAEFVPTEHRGFIPVLYPRLQTEALGIQVLTGLNGNIDIPKQTSRATGAWEGEVDAAAETTPGTDKVSLSPKRYGAFTEYSKQLMLQGSPDVEQMVRGDLSRMLAIAADQAVINGSGSGQPTGILNVSGIGSVAIGTNGGAPDWTHIVGLETEVATDNADVGNLAYLTTPGARGKLKTTALDAGSGQFVWMVNSAQLNGYRAEVSTQVPSDLTKGSGTALHAILFGNWNAYVLGQWGGFDILVDPYTQASNTLIRIYANMWVDGNARTAESFAAVTDADVS